MKITTNKINGKIKRTNLNHWISDHDACDLGRSISLHRCVCMHTNFFFFFSFFLLSHLYTERWMRAQSVYYSRCRVDNGSHNNNHHHHTFSSTFFLLLFISFNKPLQNTSIVLDFTLWFFLFVVGLAVALIYSIWSLNVWYLKRCVAMRYA